MSDGQPVCRLLRQVGGDLREPVACSDAMRSGSGHSRQSYLRSDRPPFDHAVICCFARHIHEPNWRRSKSRRCFISFYEELLRTTDRHNRLAAPSSGENIDCFPLGKHEACLRAGSVFRPAFVVQNDDTVPRHGAARLMTSPGLPD